MRERAIFTITNNPEPWLPVWLRYYSDYFRNSDIFVINHDCVGDAGDYLAAMKIASDINIVPAHCDTIYHTKWLARMAGNFQRYLLESYKVVVFAAQDEIIIRTGGTLGSFLSSLVANDLRIVRCGGYEVVHWDDSEMPLNISDDILRQRGWWYPCKRYSKPLIANGSIFWTPGFADATNATMQSHPEIKLLHLHKADRELMLARHRFTAAGVWHWEDKQSSSPNYYNLLDDPEKLDRWIQSHVDHPSERVEFERIPDEVRSIRI